jgi:hypothetical protein
MREGAGKRTTMAEHGDLQACTDETVVLHLGDDFVNKQYPAIVPTDEGTQDADMWQGDALLDRGLSIAQEVMAQAAIEGRIKRSPGRLGGKGQ